MHILIFAFGKKDIDNKAIRYSVVVFNKIRFRVSYWVYAISRLFISLITFLNLLSLKTYFGVWTISIVDIFFAVIYEFARKTSENLDD